MKIQQLKRKRNQCNRLLHPLFIAKVNEHQLIKTPENKTVHKLNMNHNLAGLKKNDGLSNDMYMYKTINFLGPKFKIFNSSH